MTSSHSRRTFLGTAGVAVISTVAGCSSGDSSATDTTQPSDDTTRPSDDTTTAEQTPTETTDAGTEAPSIDEFLSDTSNYDGVTDETGSDAVTVEVGVEANGAFYGFAPPAIRIDTGTTVTWEWTGQGAAHNVAAQYGADFESELISDEGGTYEQTFDRPDTVLYACIPHEGVGMKGAILIE